MKTAPLWSVLLSQHRGSWNELLLLYLWKVLEVQKLEVGCNNYATQDCTMPPI